MRILGYLSCVHQLRYRLGGSTLYRWVPRKQRFGDHDQSTGYHHPKSQVGKTWKHNNISMPKAGIIFFGTMAPCCSRVSKLVSGWLFDTYITSRSSWTSRNWRIDIAMLIPGNLHSMNFELQLRVGLSTHVGTLSSLTIHDSKKKTCFPKGTIND